MGKEEVGAVLKYFWVGGGQLMDLHKFSKAVIQANLLFGSETWVMTPRTGRNLGGFHHSVALFITGMNPWRYIAGKDIYPTLDAEMEEIGIEEVDSYALLCQNSIAQYILTRPIMELCLVAERTPGEQVKRW